MGRDDKFDEHALPGFYVGPSPENPEEKYVWTGSRHISVGGSFVIDETRFLQPIHLPTEFFTSWPVPVADSTIPPVPLPPRPLVKTAQILKEPLPNGTILEFRYANADFTAFDWYSGKIVDWHRRADNGIEHEVEWLDKRWLHNDWINLASSVRIWRLPLSTVPVPTAAPSAPDPPGVTRATPVVAAPAPAATGTTRATRSSTRAAALHRTRAVQPHALIVSDEPENTALVASLKKKGWLVDSMHATSDDQDITLLPVQQELRKRIIDGTYDHIVLFPSASAGHTKVAITAALALVGHRDPKAGVSITILCLVTSDAGQLDRANIWSLKPMVILKQTVSTSPRLRSRSAASALLDITTQLSGPRPSSSVPS